jgi:hypothetical protein
LGVAIFIDLLATFMCICVRECPTFGGFWLVILATWQQIRASIKEPMHVDAIVVGSVVATLALGS